MPPMLAPTPRPPPVPLPVAAGEPAGRTGELVPLRRDVAVVRQGPENLLFGSVRVLAYAVAARRQRERCEHVAVVEPVQGSRWRPRSAGGVPGGGDEIGDGHPVD